jgi:hypothetical protein
MDGINFDKDFDRNYKSKKLCFNHHETSSAAVRDEVAGESMLKEMRVCLLFQILERGVEGESVQARSKHKGSSLKSSEHGKEPVCSYIEND